MVTVPEAALALCRLAAAVSALCCALPRVSAVQTTCT